MTAPVALSPLAQVIHDTIEALPMERRLYPDLYAEAVAEAAAKFLSKNLSDDTFPPGWTKGDEWTDWHDGFTAGMDHAASVVESQA